MKEVDGKIAFMLGHIIHYQLDTLSADVVASGKTVTFGRIEVDAFLALASRNKVQAAVLERDEYAGEFSFFAFLHALIEYWDKMLVEDHVILQN